MVWQSFFSLESLSPLSLLFPENGPTIFPNHWKTTVFPMSYQIGQNPAAGWGGGGPGGRRDAHLSPFVPVPRRGIHPRLAE